MKQTFELLPAWYNFFHTMEGSSLGELPLGQLWAIDKEEASLIQCKSVLLLIQPKDYWAPHSQFGFQSLTKQICGIWSSNPPILRMLHYVCYTMSPCLIWNNLKLVQIVSRNKKYLKQGPLGLLIKLVWADGLSLRTCGFIQERGPNWMKILFGNVSLED